MTLDAPYAYFVNSDAAAEVEPAGVNLRLAFRDRADGLTLSYISAGTGDGGDQYTGLDRFGRVVDQKWTYSSGTATDEYTYTYDVRGAATGL